MCNPSRIAVTCLERGFTHCVNFAYIQLLPFSTADTLLQINSETSAHHRTSSRLRTNSYVWCNVRKHKIYSPAIISCGFRSQKQENILFVLCTTDHKEGRKCCDSGWGDGTVWSQSLSPPSPTGMLPALLYIRGEASPENTATRMTGTIQERTRSAVT
jgi:hypothetical protein